MILFLDTAFVASECHGTSPLIHTVQRLPFATQFLKELPRYEVAERVAKIYAYSSLKLAGESNCTPWVVNGAE
jgi:hypothetical protein